MLKLIRNLVVVVALAMLGLYVYYGTISPCEMLKEARSAGERPGIVERVQRMTSANVENMTAMSCAAELPKHWLSAAESFWQDRPAEN